MYKRQEGVLPYGERLKVKGLKLLSAPGNDLVAATALASCGCNMALRMAVAIFSSLNPTTRPSRLSTVCIITFYAKYDCLF